METTDSATQALPQPPRRVTSADVARACGVSRATVSYVLNDTPHRSISEATRKLVLETAARLGHVPSASARALRSGTSQLVLALVPGLQIGSLFDRMLAMVNDHLANQGYALLIHQHAEEVRPLSELWRLVNPTLVLATNGVSETEKAAIHAARVAVVDVSELASFAEIGRVQTEHVISRGHHVLAIATPFDRQLETFAAERLEGIDEVCLAHGVARPVRLVMRTDGTDVKETVDAWEAMDPRPTAFCCYNDDLALMLWSELNGRGHRPGVDVALVGVDDVPLAGIGLTTVSIDVAQLAAQIIEAIEHRLGVGPAPEPAPVSRLLRLVVRTSS